MADHCEEQEMEAEALTAIFDDCLEIVSATQPFQWAITLWPEQHSLEEENHVGIKLIAKIPLDYPESSVPELDIELLKGLTEDHRTKLLGMAQEEAENNLGLPSIFAVSEVLREWLAENNQKGQDDLSMYAQMMRRTKEKEREAKKATAEFESQKQVEAMTEAEAEDLAVRKRRAEGTPVTPESFAEWKMAFEKEMAEKKQLEEEEKAVEQARSKEKIVDKSGRITGFLQFSKGANFDLEAMEAAAENAEEDEDDLIENVNEALFDVDDDDLDDLDDLDFDDEEDEDEEPDI
eukprot:Nitzschia sp. Nitz4//scaffold203_size38902//28910//30095//NITZ4_007665-RA/size38902-augustus-gene-0.50-mRNA-1//-1//CDS//3329541439//7821//frame0